MKLDLLKGAGLAIVAGITLMAPLGTAANAGVLDQLRSRGLGDLVDKYVDKKNGEFSLKQGKSGSISEYANRAGLKNSIKKYTNFSR